jgi:hypothetical protein
MIEVYPLLLSVSNLALAQPCVQAKRPATCAGNWNPKFFFPVAYSDEGGQ